MERCKVPTVRRWIPHGIGPAECCPLQAVSGRSRVKNKSTSWSCRWGDDYIRMGNLKRIKHKGSVITMTMYKEGICWGEVCTLCPTFHKVPSGARGDQCCRKGPAPGGKSLQTGGNILRDEKVKLCDVTSP